jgi:threonine dehydratase
MTTDANPSGSTPVEHQPPTIESIRDAQLLLDGVSRVTPVLGARWLSERVGGQAYLKLENFQRAGSFKIRGAYTRMARLDPELRARGVVAASAGNHAQGVALAGRLLGIAVTVFMPEGAPLPKVAATRGYGADVRFAGPSVETAMVAARAFAAETGATLIHPYDHADIVSGQGTIGLEILEQVPEFGSVVVCTGGGGLLAGIALAIKSARPDVKVYGVQAERAAGYVKSLEVGEPVVVPPTGTMADGIAIARPGDVDFPIVRDLVEEVITVSEEDLSRAVLILLERSKIVVEPAGAAAVAAVMANPEKFTTPVVCTVSGGNVDPLLLMRIIRHGLISAGRFLSVEVRVPDSPGALAGLLTALGAAGANVLEVEHDRTDPALGVDEVDIRVVLETRGHEHAAAVEAELIDKGYTLR